MDQQLLTFEEILRWICTDDQFAVSPPDLPAPGPVVPTSIADNSIQNRDNDNAK